MAQTKARASSKRSGGSQKSQARSRGSTSKTSKPGSSKTAKPASSGKARKAPKSRRRPSGPSAKRSKSPSNGAGPIDSARQSVEHTAKDAGQAVGRVASKAKVPLMAGGAALAGAAGGLALGMRQRRNGLIRRPRRPQVKVKSSDLTKAAKEVGTFGAEMGRLASELQRTRQAANGGKHRSPVEVVLEGLTSRRSG